MARLRAMLVLGWLVCCLSGAVPAGTSGVVVRVWQSQDGLPGNVVRSVVQSTDGHIWVATAEGVARFDGYDFELIEPEGELKRSRLAFSRLFATSRGGIWAATYQGGLFHFRDGALRSVLRDARGPRSPIVTQLFEDRAGNLFFQRGGETGRIHPDGTVEPVQADDSLRGLIATDLERRKERGRVFEAEAKPFLRDRAERLWSVDAAGGLTITEAGRDPVSVDFPRRGPVFGINEMLLDQEGNVWVASPINGLARVKQARVEMPAIEGNDGGTTFSSLIQKRSGEWWLADRRGGLMSWHEGRNRRVEFHSARGYRAAAALFEDRESKLWVASRDGSVFVEQDGGFVPMFVRTQTPSKVRAITQDAAGVMWFGGTQGIASYANDQVRVFGRAEGVPDADVSMICPFPGGGVIAGTTDGRILLGGSGGFTIIERPESAGRDWISGILPVSANEVWVSTLGGGLHLWNGKSWRVLGPDDGLPDQRLTCVIDDSDGNLWLGSLSGIIRAEREELLAHLNDSREAVQWLRLDHTDGLPSRECIGGFQPAGWRGSDGMLWFPTGGGVVMLRPDLVQPNRVPPPVFLKSVRSNGVAHTGQSGPVITEPGRARLEFRFVGLSLGAPDKVTYRARLAGLDDSWRELGNQRVAAFEAVPPGRYTFEVMAVNGDGLRSPAPARISVVVKPRFWQTSWFYLTAGAAVLSAAAGTGWFGARLRLRRRIQALKIRGAREAERSRIARDLHDDLGAGLTEISILAALAAEDAEKTPLQPALEQLSLKAKQVVSSLDEIVWAVNPREDSLASLVEYAAAFAREFLDNARIPLRVDIEPGIPDHPLAAPVRHAVFLAVREALNNAAKHSGATEVTFSARIRDGALEIYVTDNGRGFDLEYAASGHGLGNLHHRMQEAGGGCRIESRRGAGTTVTLTLPLHPQDKPVS